MCPPCARLTGFLKPGTLTLYADAVPAKLLIHQRLKGAEDGQVEVLKKLWHFADAGEERGVMPAVLAYADLLAVGDSRTVEAANRYRAPDPRRRFCRRPLRAAGSRLLRSPRAGRRIAAG